MDVSKVLSDENVKYYAHGTGRVSANDSDGRITSSIFENGLLAYSSEFGEAHKDLTSTAYPIGYGSPDLYQNAYSVLNNNRHLGSKRIIIIGLPTEYLLPVHFVFSNEREAAYFDARKFWTDEEDREFWGDDVPARLVLMPEFIVGAYDATTQTFIANENYYKNSNKKLRDETFEKVKQNYISHLKERFVAVNLNSGMAFTIEDYLNVFKDSKFACPLSEDELSELDAFVKDVIANPSRYETYLQQEDSENPNSSASSDERRGESLFNWDDVDMSWLDEMNQ